MTAVFSGARIGLLAGLSAGGMAPYVASSPMLPAKQSRALWAGILGLAGAALGLAGLAAGEYLVATRAAPLLTPLGRGPALAPHELKLLAVFGLLVLVVVGLVGLALWLAGGTVREVARVTAALGESEERYRKLVENSSELVMLHGLDGQPSYVSPSVERLLGHTQAEVLAVSSWALVHPDDVGTRKYQLQRLQSGEIREGTVTYRLRTKNGEYKFFEFQFARIDDQSGEPLHVQSAGRDVTLRRNLERRLAEQTEELRTLSLRDGLTGLYNRRGFLELSAQVVRMAEREQYPLAVLFADLDGLKEINDQLGHEHGDRAILEAAELLHGTVRATDVVARLGGDEFVILAPHADADNIRVLKERIERCLVNRKTTTERPYFLSLSLGVAFFDPAQPVAIEALIKEADSRMYEDKHWRRASRPSNTGPASQLRSLEQRPSDVPELTDP